MKINRVLPALVGTACLALLLAAAGLGAQTAGSSGTGDSNASAADKMFVQKAMAGGLAEVELGQLAARKASSDDVKQFGKKMAEDHARLNDLMKPVAGQLGVDSPDGISPADKALVARLNDLSGQDFDTAYMQAMVKDHRKDLAEFKKESLTAHSGAVKEAASQGRQVIAGHLKLAQQIADKHEAENAVPDR